MRGCNKNSPLLATVPQRESSLGGLAAPLCIIGELLPKKANPLLSRFIPPPTVACQATGLVVSIFYHRSAGLSSSESQFGTLLCYAVAQLYLPITLRFRFAWHSTTPLDLAIA